MRSSVVLALFLVALTGTEGWSQTVTTALSAAQQRRLCAEAREVLRSGTSVPPWDSTFAYGVLRWCGKSGLASFIGAWWRVRGSSDTTTLWEMHSSTSTATEQRLRDTLMAIVGAPDGSEEAQLSALRTLLEGRRNGWGTFFDSLPLGPIDAPCPQYWYTDATSPDLPAMLAEQVDSFLASVLDQHSRHRVRRMAFCWLDAGRGSAYGDSAQADVALAIRRSIAEGDVDRLELAYEDTWKYHDARIVVAAIQVATSRTAARSARLFALRTLWWADHWRHADLPTDWLLGIPLGSGSGRCPVGGAYVEREPSGEFPVTPVQLLRIREAMARVQGDTTLDPGVRWFAGCV